MMVKTGKEIKLLIKAANIANSCIPLIKKSLKEEMTEKELAKRVRKKMKEQGATEAFRMIVCSGKRAARIHAKPATTNRLIKGLGYVDFGASYKGYRSDITVPFIKGKISKKERKVADAVAQAYRVAVRTVKVGLPCWKVHEKTNKFLISKGFAMQHAMGHGLGKIVHELPYIGMPRKRLTKKKQKRWQKLKKIAFQPGMVFTIEPAVYVKGLCGCRLENDFLMTKNGLRTLTKSKLIKDKSLTFH